MNLTKRSSIIFLSILLIFMFAIFMCGKEEQSEISNHKDIISCRYLGLNERNGQPIVELIFKNNSGKNLKAVYGGLQIINSSGDVVQRTGFTYSRPFLANEEKSIPAFAYINLKEESLKVLSSATDFIPMHFELSEIVFEDGQKVNY